MENSEKWVFHKICKTCGKLCGDYRRDILKMTQFDVAKEIGYSKENIAAFEQGRNDNNIIFMWYVKNGLLSQYSIEELLGWWKNEKTV